MVHHRALVSESASCKETAHKLKRQTRNAGRDMQWPRPQYGFDYACMSVLHVSPQMHVNVRACKHTVRYHFKSTSYAYEITLAIRAAFLGE